MTLIASATMLFSSRHHRWLTKKEMLTVQGFAIDPKHTYGEATSSFTLRTCFEASGMKPPFEWPSRRQACHQSGNSMHVAVAGLISLYAFTQIAMNQAVLEARSFLSLQDKLLPRHSLPKSLPSQAMSPRTGKGTKRPHDDLDDQSNH